VSQTQ